MKVRYHIATISFSTNLTKPDGEPTPIGVLLLGEAPTFAYVALSVREDEGLLEPLPRLIRSIVRDFPSMLRAQLEEILGTTDGGTSIDALLEQFEDSLRNSFYVSDIKMNQEVEIPESPGAADPYVAYPQAMKTASERLVAAHVRPDEVRQHYRPWMNTTRRITTAGLLA